MAQMQMKPAPLATGTGLGIMQTLAACNFENNAPLANLQQNWLATRFRLDASRARLVADLAFRGVRL